MLMTWLLLRGLMRDQRHWGEFPQLLEQQLANSRVVTLDFPGNGALHTERSLETIEEMAHWCRTRLRERSLFPPYCVLANSLGAMVAVAWAVAHPADLAAAVLINTSMRPYGAAHQRMRPAAWPTLLRMAFGSPDARTTESAILRLTSFRQAENAQLLDQWVAWREAAPVSRANALRQLIAAARFHGPPVAPRPPVLLLAGGKDRLVNPRCSQRMAQAWNGTFVLHANAGHDLPLDDAHWVIQQVQAWLARQPLLLQAAADARRS